MCFCSKQRMVSHCPTSGTRFVSDTQLLSVQITLTSSLYLGSGIYADMASTWCFVVIVKLQLDIIVFAGKYVSMRFTNHSMCEMCWVCTFFSRKLTKMKCWVLALRISSNTRNSYQFLTIGAVIKLWRYDTPNRSPVQKLATLLMMHETCKLMKQNVTTVILTDWHFLIVSFSVYSDVSCLTYLVS